MFQHSPEQLKQMTTCLKTFFKMSSHVIQVSGDPEIPIWFEKMIFTPLFRAQVFARAAALKALSLSPSGVGARAQPRLKGVRNVFPNQSGISGLLETWITPDKLYGDISWASYGCFTAPEMFWYFPWPLVCMDGELIMTEFSCLFHVWANCFFIPATLCACGFQTHVIRPMNSIFVIV